MKALSLHQPWASLCVTRQPCVEGVDAFLAALDAWPMVKRFETRSWPCPPNLIGQRITLHATKRSFPGGGIQRTGDWWFYVGRDGAWMQHGEPDSHGPSFIPGAPDTIPLPLGAIVGSATIQTSLPINDRRYMPNIAEQITINPATGMLRHWGRALSGDDTDVSDQLPYGDFTPGRYAWLLTDAAPTTERCPWCWGTGEAFAPNGLNVVCVCGGAGSCEPIPARGRQRIWEWTP